MGLFDKIKKAAASAKDGYVEAYQWANGKELKEIHQAMMETKVSEVAKLSGYKMVFREKCEALDSKSLVALHRELKSTGFILKTNHAQQILEDILVERGIFHRDEDGVVTEY